MLIRISLIIAILAGLAAAGLGFVKVGERLVTTMNERDQFHKEADSEKAEKQKAQSELKTTKAELGTTKTALGTTKTQLQAMTTKAAEQEKKASDLAGQMDRVKGERDAAQQKLTAWELIPLTPDQIKGTLAELKKTQDQRDVYIGENKIMLQKNKQLQAQLDNLIGTDKPVLLPVGLKGKVIAVDPKYDFVILDIGGNQGVLERGEMLVNRNGKLIAKVRIATVEANRSVANVLPGWKQDEVMEGDQVLY
jgi:myosin heavy subunit